MTLLENRIIGLDNLQIVDIYNEIEELKTSRTKGLHERSELLAELIELYREDCNTTSPMQVVFFAACNAIQYRAMEEGFKRFAEDIRNIRIKLDSYTENYVNFEEIRKAIMPGTAYHEMVDEAIAMSKMVDMLNPPEDKKHD